MGLAWQQVARVQGLIKVQALGKGKTETESEKRRRREKQQDDGKVKKGGGLTFRNRNTKVRLIKLWPVFLNERHVNACMF